MSRNRYLIVFDYETDWDPNKLDQLGIVQIAAVPVDLRNLDILIDEIFAIDVKPADAHMPEYFAAHQQTIEWHSRQQNCSPQEVYERWLAGVPEKDAWDEFCKYIKGYAKSAKFDEMPMAGGQNIRGFDLPITRRFGEKFNKKAPFSKRESDIIDLLDLSTQWFMWADDKPKSYSLDSLRDFFGVDKFGAHDAKKDVIDCADFIKRFLGIYERIAPRINWRPEVLKNV